MSTKSKFEGKPLIELPEVIPVANYLTGDFGKEALGEYKERASEDYNNNRYLTVLNFQDNVVKGSNPFAVILMNQVLAQEGIRTATPADLELILRTNALNLRNQYEDSALVLRSTDDPNKYLAKDLEQQLKARGKVKYPLMIPLTSLELINDDNSNYKLTFKLRESSVIIYASQLAHENNGKRFSETDEQGLPIFDLSGSRILYTRDSGLSRLGLGGNLGLGSLWDGLDDSSAGGRVVAVRGEATRADLKADLITN